MDFFWITVSWLGPTPASSLTGLRVLGAITPIGGVAFLTGWLLLAVAALREKD